MEMVLQYVALVFLVVGVTANVIAMGVLCWMFYDMFKGKKQ
jgi:hypothetical protein